MPSSSAPFPAIVLPMFRRLLAVHLPLLLLLLRLVVHAHFDVSPDLRDVRSILRSEGQWTRRMGEEFVRHNVLPFIRQFRRQLKPPRNIQWAPGGSNLLPIGPNQQRKNIAKWGDHDESLAMFTHVDLDPAEQRKYRKTRSAASLFDLGGLIARELWKQTKHRCVHCADGLCELADPQCGFPYQLFDEHVEQIYCELTLAKKKRQNPVKKAPLKAKMKCATFPPTPSVPNTLLATNYEKNWKLMCVNCTFPRQSDGDTDYDNGYGNVGQDRQNWTMENGREEEVAAYGSGDNNYDSNYMMMAGRGKGGTEWEGGRGGGGGWQNGREMGEGWEDGGGGRGGEEGKESGRNKYRNNYQRNNNNNDYPNYNNGGAFGGENGGQNYHSNANAISFNKTKNGNFYNAKKFGNEWQGKQRIMRVKTDQKFTLKYQINAEEGQVIAAYINKSRARIARGEASDLPIASGMNEIKWKGSLAAEAVKLLGTNQNRAVNVLDLEVVHLIAGGYGQGGKDADYGMRSKKALAEEGYGNQRDYEFFSSLDQNYIELKATDVLLMVVKNYLEMFMGQKGLSCDENSCKATCKLPKRDREGPMKREDENPSEYFCYPYELIYDRTHSIGCAVHFETKRKTELRGKLVCIMSTQHGHKKMLHHHNVFKVGSSCSNCERGLTCDAKGRLCVRQGNRRPNGRRQMPTTGREMDYPLGT